MKAGAELVLRVASATFAIGAIAMLVGSFQARARKHVEPEPARIAPIARIDRAAETPIAIEAAVFEATTLEGDAARRTTAHPRTLATFRTLRPYPGAPPRIPHGLTADEFRATRCRTCHERGGYSARFESYAPITPHPELMDCMQCHVADDAVVGIALPDDTPDALCHQCHARGATPQSRTLRAWHTAPWPQIGQPSLEGAPPEIPHDLHMRRKCSACHAGPGAVAEIRTDHPERMNCLQCHLMKSDLPVFRRAGGQL